MASAKRLRALLADQSKIIVCPGVYDGLTARIALNAGFECLYMVTKPHSPKIQDFVSDVFLRSDRSWNNNIKTWNARSRSGHVERYERERRHDC
jgi:hypothetical protein